MKRRIIAGSVFVIALLMTPVVARPLFGPKGKFSTLIYDLKWEPGYTCNKPMRPFTDDKYAWEIYKSSALSYLECLRDAANSDIEYAAEVINDGYEKASDDFVDEVKRGY